MGGPRRAEPWAAPPLPSWVKMNLIFPGGDGLGPMAVYMYSLLAPLGGFARAPIVGCLSEVPEAV